MGIELASLICRGSHRLSVDRNTFFLLSLVVAPFFVASYLTLLTTKKSHLKGGFYYGRRVGLL